MTENIRAALMKLDDHPTKYLLDIKAAEYLQQNTPCAVLLDLGEGEYEWFAPKEILEELQEMGMIYLNLPIYGPNKRSIFIVARHFSSASFKLEGEDLDVFRDFLDTIFEKVN
ncbi:MAG TPA: hypothetical protein VG895_01215 [Patescibacteria group bacterium]|nr:hypothetical protein [Patescibacteria group bacterium]